MEHGYSRLTNMKNIPNPQRLLDMIPEMSISKDQDYFKDIANYLRNMQIEQTHKRAADIRTFTAAALTGLLAHKDYRSEYEDEIVINKAILIGTCVANEFYY